jgi:archaellum component FlaC
MDRIPINKYPYTDFHELNLDWVIERIQEMYTIIDQKIADAIAPINAQINTINGRLNTIETNYNNLSDTVSNHTNMIEQHSMQIQGIGSTLGSILGDINTINTDIGELRTTTEDLNSRVEAHTDAIFDIYRRLDDIDPDTGLIVDATNFNTENRTASVMDPVYDFHLTGSLGAEQFVLYPDLIPGTQAGYYPRVTMVYDSNVLLHLPSELTPAGQGVTYPAIIRGTYATNVDKNGDIYSGDPLEYSINGEVFTVDGYDENAIILMCIDCLHRGVDEYENVYTNNGVEVVHGVPFTDIVGDYKSYIGSISHRNPLPYGLEAYVYFFDIDGALLGKRVLPRDDNPTSIPAGTYSIWYGIGTSAAHESWTNTTFHIMRETMAGSYKVSNDNLVTEHKVRFLYHSGNEWNVKNHIVNKIGGIYGLGPNEQIDMFTGDIKIGSTIIPSRKFDLYYDGFKNLTPDLQYNVELQHGERYTDADLKYNKVMALINNLDANNVRY